MSDPSGVAIDAQGNIYIAEIDNQRVRKVNAAGIITTIVGTGATGFLGGGYSGDGGPATAAEIKQPGSIRLDCGGNLYIPNASDYHVRKVTYNHAPYFQGGHTQSLTVCEDSVTAAVDTLLAVFDIDTLQTAAWVMVLPPTHGTAAAAYTGTTYGNVMMPTGLSYRPATGYIGNDTFRVAVTDCGHLSDTTTIYVNVKTGCNVGTNNVQMRKYEHVKIWPNPNEGSFSITILSANNEQANVVVTNVMGMVVKEMTLMSNKEQEIKLNVPAGIYFITAITAEGVASGKIIVGL